jgi:HPt (histidine-containing phosphotransfer) domain-containing protein
MTDAGVIDRAVLDQLLDSFGGDVGFLGEMLDTFFEDAPRQLDAMRSGLATGDSETVRRAAHSLKSNSANFGALALSARCKELELLAKDGTLQGGDALSSEIVADIVADIAAEYEQAHAALETIRTGD